MAVGEAELRRRLSPSTPWSQRLVVEPFLDRQIDGCAMDFYLGCRFAVWRRRGTVSHDPVRDPRGSDELARMHYVPLGESVVIHAKQGILATTLEWFRLPPDLVGDIDARSIWGRTGLTPATAHKMSDRSFGVVTLELVNTSDVAVVVRPGVAIGQIIFHTIESPRLESENEDRPYSQFCGTDRPLPGEYRPSSQEEFLLG